MINCTVPTLQLEVILRKNELVKNAIGSYFISKMILLKNKGITC
jgi:hypothetical protein